MVPGDSDKKGTDGGRLMSDYFPILLMGGLIFCCLCVMFSVLCFFNMSVMHLNELAMLHFIQLIFVCLILICLLSLLFVCLLSLFIVV